MQRHQYNMGVVGNCAYSAHIDTSASVRWLCWPQFDSEFVFGGLLDSELGGDFSINTDPANAGTHQYYIDNTNVLCTEFKNDDGHFKVIDFAPRFRQYDRYYKPLMLVRKIQPVAGQPVIRVRCKPVTGNGSSAAVPMVGSNHLTFRGDEQELRLTTNISLPFIRNEKSFILNETKYLVLTYGIPLEANLEYTCEDFLKKTIHYWRDWIKGTYLPSLHQEQIIRSALVLKIHHFEQSGAIIASSTTSLPEAPGSGRNWDYRYCWLRDTYYTLTAFNRIGHFDELESYFHFIANITVHHKTRLQPLYSIDGGAALTEKVLPLKGYLGNTPVRVGNAAYLQTQNDVYGQVLVSLLPLYTDKRFIHRERAESVNIVKNLLQMIEQTMEEEDAGLWEYRNSKRKHGYTFLFHWAGCSAAMKIFDTMQEESHLRQYAAGLRERASAMIEQCYNPVHKAYMDAISSSNFDASLIQLITLGYLPSGSEKAHLHLQAIEKNLMTEHGLFYRYKHHDDFGVPETTFLICSFWHVEALAMLGRVDEAMSRFEHLLQYSNHLGLLSEDVDAATGSQWGNFPQTYSHVGLINAAFRIGRKIDKPDFL